MQTSGIALPDWLLQTVAQHLNGSPGYYAAQLLWQRGQRDRAQLEGFLSPDCYQPASPDEFGQDMHRAVQRLTQAYHQQEQVAIWGDFDADGVTATALLWEGLGQFFVQGTHLSYVIPNRLTDSHGLSQAGVDTLAAQGCRLIVTCDTGSNNLSELAYAQSLGIDVIVTDHHTLPDDRPPVVAILNPRYLPNSHPLARLSGVAVAYKLMEAFYQALPEVPQRPLSDLLDLVAIGLIADLVELTDDCRYLAQVGIAQLQITKRPGILQLLALCKRNGDRPTDISFGIGPRINAVSRIYGDARLCVELLTSWDAERCRKLAEDAELANTRRKALQRDIANQVRQQLARIDLSTTSVIVLADPQWSVGVLGLVAGEIAQDYNRPTILLQTETVPAGDQPPLARGSARSVNAIDLYSLVKSQAHLLHRFGGHPLAAGLSLPVENVPLFTEAINRQCRQHIGSLPVNHPPQADLTVTVAELGKSLFRELKLLEPFGMGNPVPRLRIQNCWFEDGWHENIKDRRGQKVMYIKTTVSLWDHTVEQGFPGVWWEHYKTDIPTGLCNAIVELDVHNDNYVARLIAVNPASLTPSLEPDTQSPIPSTPLILDWRRQDGVSRPSPIPHPSPSTPNPLILDTCPYSWAELRHWWHQAMAEQRPLAIAYGFPSSRSPYNTLKELVALAKQLSRTGQPSTSQQLCQQLGIRDRTLDLGLTLLTAIGFQIKTVGEQRWLSGEIHSELIPETIDPLEFLAAVQADQFQQKYFTQVPLSVIQAVASSDQSF